MILNESTSVNTEIKNSDAENLSAKILLFVESQLTIQKTYTYGAQWNFVTLSNVKGDTQSISVEKFIYMCEQILDGKKFVQTIQTPYRGFYQGKESNKPDIKIMGNVHFEKGYILLEVLQSKDGSIAIASTSDVHKRSYYKINETILFAYYEMFMNEKVANESLSKLSLERSVILSECISL